MNILINLLNLLPDHWPDVLEKSSLYENQLQSMQQHVKRVRPQADQFIKNLFVQAANHEDALLHTFSQSAFFKVCANVHIDVKALLSVPAHFDADNPAHIADLVKQKAALLQAALEPAQVSNINWHTVLHHVQQLVLQFVTVPGDLNFDDNAAVAAFQKQQITALAPHVAGLLQQLAGSALPDLPPVNFSALSDQAAALLPNDNADNNDEALKNPIPFIQERVVQVADMVAQAGVTGVNAAAFKNQANAVAHWLHQKLPQLEAALAQAEAKPLKAADLFALLQQLINQLAQAPAVPGLQQAMAQFQHVLEQIKTGHEDEQPASGPAQHIIAQCHKVWLLWQFLEQQHIGITIAPKAASDVPQYDVDFSAPGPAQSANWVGTTTTEPPPAATAQPNAATQPQPTAHDWAEALLNDPVVMDLLPQALQATARKLLTGAFTEEVINRAITMAKAQTFKNLLTGRWQGLQQLINNQQHNNLGSIAWYCAESLCQLIPLCLEVLEQIMLYAVEVIHQLFSFGLEVLLHLKIKEEKLPAWLTQHITLGHAPNLACLLVALPAETLQKLYALPAKELKNWLAGATG